MRFIVTRELGRLAKWLRIFGLDTVYFKPSNFSSLLIKALQEDRVIVTKNSKIGIHPALRIINIDSDNLGEQLKGFFKKLNLHPAEEFMFSRCTLCNEELEAIDKGKVQLRVPKYVYKTQSSFMSCPKCARIYWPGTHWGNVKNTLKEINA